MTKLSSLDLGPLLMFVVTVSMASVTIHHIWKCDEIYSWPKVDAIYHSGETYLRGDMGAPICLNVSYTYNNVLFNNINISYYYGIPDRYAGLNNEFLRKIQPGSSMSLFVNPSNPEEAYAESHPFEFYYDLIYIVLPCFMINIIYYFRHKFISLYKKLKEFA